MNRTLRTTALSAAATAALLAGVTAPAMAASTSTAAPRTLAEISIAMTVSSLT